MCHNCHFTLSSHPPSNLSNHHLCLGLSLNLPKTISSLALPSSFDRLLRFLLPLLPSYLFLFSLEKNCKNGVNDRPMSRERKFINVKGKIKNKSSCHQVLSVFTYPKLPLQIFCNFCPFSYSRLVRILGIKSFPNRITEA